MHSLDRQPAAGRAAQVVQALERRERRQDPRPRQRGHREQERQQRDDDTHGHPEEALALQERREELLAAAQAHARQEQDDAELSQQHAVGRVHRAALLAGPVVREEAPRQRREVGRREAYYSRSPGAKGGAALVLRRDLG